LATYTTKADVKPILSIDGSDTTFDNEIDECLASAYNVVNSFAEAQGFSVPFSSPVHQNVKDFERYAAAWLFRRRRASPEEADFLWDMAVKFWQAYADAEKGPVVLST
jgi:hypothetical protein